MARVAFEGAHQPVVIAPIEGVEHHIVEPAGVGARMEVR
jgi:hypothetical protein